MSASQCPHLMIVIHSLGGGGAERVAIDMAGYWYARGCRVTLVTLAGAERDAYSVPAGVTRHALGLSADSTGLLTALGANVRRILALRRLFRVEQPGVVLAMMTSSSVLSVCAAIGLPCRVIATEHTHPPAQALPGPWQRLRRWAFRRAAAVVVLTRGTADWFRREIPGTRIRVIPNAVRWPLQEGDPVVDARPVAGRHRMLAVGRLHPVKGFDCLLRAFAKVAPDFPDWDLVILGEGPQRATLEDLCAGLALQDRVRLPGRVGNMAQWYAQADLYVLSSRFEGLSNSLLEAMASGLPSVAFDCDTGPREIIRDGIDGALVQPPQDADALAECLALLMANPALRTRFAARAVDVRDRFSVARVMTLWEHLFQGRAAD